MKVARNGPYRRQRAARVGVALGLIVVLAGCCATARRPALASQEEPPAERAVEVDADGSPAQGSPTGTAERTTSAPVLQAEVRDWNGKPLLVIETEVPGPRWRAVLVPLPVTEDSAREFRLVLVPPPRGENESATAPADEPNATTRHTVLASETFPPSVEQVVIYGTDDALVIPTS